MANVGAQRDRARAWTYFRVLVAGNAVSSFGSFLNMVALNLFVLESTGSALQMGLFMALRLASGFVAGLVGGAVADRLPRKPVMIGCDLVQAGVLVGLVAAPQSIRVDLLPLVAIAIGLLTTTSGVLLRSSVPDLVGAEHRLRANGLLVTGRAVAMALGFATGGVLISWLGYRAAFLADAATFAVSALTLAVVPLAFPGPHRRGTTGPATAAVEPTAEASGVPETTGETAGAAELAGREGFWTRQRVAFVALRAAPAVAVIVLIRAVDALGSASHNVGIPVYATQQHPSDPAGFVGSFWGVWAVGLVAAHQLTTWLQRASGGSYSEPRHNERGFIVGTCVMSAAFIAAFLGIPLPWVLIVAFLAGLADGFTEITYTTRVQAEPDPARGYFFGMTAMAESAGLGVGMLVAAGLLEVWSPLGVAGAMHGAVIVLALAFVLGTAARAGRRAPEPTPAPPREEAGRRG